MYLTGSLFAAAEAKMYRESRIQPFHLYYQHPQIQTALGE